MFTTVGEAVFAMLWNVSSVSAPVTGALFIAGTARLWADDAGVRSRRDAMTIPTNRDAVIASSTENTLVLRVDLVTASGGPARAAYINSRISDCRDPLTDASRSPTTMLISVRTPKSSK